MLSINLHLDLALQYRKIFDGLVFVVLFYPNSEISLAIKNNNEY